jgi:hypothetical protein
LPVFVVQKFPNFLAVHDTFFPPSLSGSPAILASHLFKNTTATTLLAQAATKPFEVILNLCESPDRFPCILSHVQKVAGGAVSKFSPHATSVNPGWHKALHLVIFASGWTSLTPPSIRDTLQQTLTSQTSLFVPFSEGLGMYLNEADQCVFYMACYSLWLKWFSRNNLDWPLSFWGDNYECLLEMKHKL